MKLTLATISPRRAGLPHVATFALLATCLALQSRAEAGEPQRVPLQVTAFRHIKMGDLPPTHYRNIGAALAMNVRSSASFLLLPFKQQRLVQGVNFRWRAAGTRRVNNAASEESKNGDDYRLRIGLLLAGKEAPIPLLAPGWVKAVRTHLTLPCDRIRFLVVGSHHMPGTVWKSPYHDSIEYLAVSSKTGRDGSAHASIDWPNPLRVVGIWLMADGDNSDSSFETVLEELSLW